MIITVKSATGLAILNVRLVKERQGHSYLAQRVVLARVATLDKQQLANVLFVKTLVLLV